MRRLELNGTLLLILLGLAFFGVSCQSLPLIPPRLATTEAMPVTPAAPEVEPINLPAPTATGQSPVQEAIQASAAPALSVWVNETSPEHRELLRTMADDFHERTGIDVAVQYVDPALLPQLAQTAVLSNTLPDVILHPLEFSIAWSEAGIIDPTAANAAVEELGRSTFNESALELVDYQGLSAAVPSHGYPQLWFYRSDWFGEADLDIPNSYSTMQEGAETFFDPDNLISGLVIPTESNLINTQRTFEHIALANDCHLFAEDGEILLLEPACREALDFYFGIVNQFSPPGVQTDTSARNAFLDGRTAIIVSSPSLIPDLVRTNRLDRKTGIVTRLRGADTNEGIDFANITYLGITPVADKEAAGAFVSYWFNEGYQSWLNQESERKVPMRLGTADRPTFYIDAWGTAPILEGESLNDIVGPEILSQLRESAGSANRWGFSQNQGAIMGDIYEGLTFSIVLQEMLSGYFNSAKTIFEAYNRIVRLVPDYAFPIIPTPTPEA